MKYISLCLLFAILTGCAEQELKPKAVNVPTPLMPKQTEKVDTGFIDGLDNVSQDVSLYSANIDKGYISSLDNYAKHYFQAWNIDTMDIPLKDAMWAYKAFNEKNSYGENLQPLDRIFFQKMLENSNFLKYATLNQRGITLKKLNIRAFPTDRPVLRDPKQAGEGFPFDYMQNTSIAANKPIFISHYSKDRAWVFIKSSFAYGWVKARDITFLANRYTRIWQDAQQIFFTQDNKPLYAPKKEFLFYSTIGTMLPLIEEKSKEFSVLTIANYKLNRPYYINTTLNKRIGHNGILAFNTKNINKIMRQLLHVNYGWGGLYNQRDCSSTLRDFFAPFGIWLPRNSYQQSKVGEVISLENMSDEEKMTLIKKKGIAFETLLYKKGHIVLYVGTYHDKIIIFQNVWGIKTLDGNKEGRLVVGEPVFSTLEMGSNLSNFDKNASLLKNLKSMNILTH